MTSVTGLSRTAHVHMTHLESWSRISRPPPRTRPKIPFPHARTRSAKNFFESVSSRPHSRPDKIIRAIKAEAQKKKSPSRKSVKKKESKNCNVSRLRCQCNHRRCRQPLAASSFTRSPRTPLLRSRRSITSFTQHSALGAGTQLDAEPAPPSHTPAETQSRTSCSATSDSGVFSNHPLEWPVIILAQHSRPRSPDIILPAQLAAHVSARRVPAQQSRSTSRSARTQHTARDAEH